MIVHPEPTTPPTFEYDQGDLTARLWIDSEQIQAFISHCIHGQVGYAQSSLAGAEPFGPEDYAAIARDAIREIVKINGASWVRDRAMDGVITIVAATEERPQVLEREVTFDAGTQTYGFVLALTGQGKVTGTGFATQELAWHACEEWTARYPQISFDGFTVEPVL